LAYWYAAGPKASFIQFNRNKPGTMSLTGKTGVVFGVANKRSIAWAIAQAWHKAGARLAFTYQ